MQYFYQQLKTMLVNISCYRMSEEKNPEELQGFGKFHNFSFWYTPSLFCRIDFLAKVSDRFLEAFYVLDETSVNAGGGGI